MSKSQSPFTDEEIRGFVKAMKTPKAPIGPEIAKSWNDSKKRQIGRIPCWHFHTLID